MSILQEEAKSFLSPQRKVGKEHEIWNAFYQIEASSRLRINYYDHKIFRVWPKDIWKVKKSIEHLSKMAQKGVPMNNQRLGDTIWSKTPKVVSFWYSIGQNKNWNLQFLNELLLVID